MLLVLLAVFLLMPFFWSAEAWKSDVSHSSVWKITSQHHCNNKNGTAFAIGSNQFITNFHVIKGLLDKVVLNIGPLKVTQSEIEDFFPLVSFNLAIDDLILSQEGGNEEIRINKILAVSAVYDLVRFETKESVEDYLNIAKSLDSTEELSIYGYPIVFKGDLKTYQKKQVV